MYPRNQKIKRSEYDYLICIIGLYRNGHVFKQSQERHYGYMHTLIFKDSFMEVAWFRTAFNVFLNK